MGCGENMRETDGGRKTDRSFLIIVKNSHTGLEHVKW